MNDHMVKLYQ